MGDHVWVRGWLKGPRLPTVKRKFDEKSYWASRGIYSLLRVWSQDSFSKEPLGRPRTWQQRAWQFHQRFKDFWFERLPLEEAALVCGISIGARGVLPKKLKEKCVNAGVYHMVVASGQNIAIVVALAFFLFRSFRIPKRWAFVLCSPLILFYMQAVGSDPPAVRAAIMGLVAVVILFLARDVPPFYPLVLAAFVMLLLRPEWIFGASFQLSFGATASLLYAFPRVNFEVSLGKRILGWFLKAGKITFAVQVGIWPLLAHYFHQISVVGLIANCLLMPLAAVILGLGLVIGGVGIWLGSWIPGWALLPLRWIVQLMLFGIKGLGGWSWSAVSVPSPSWFWIAIYYVILICILIFRNGIRRKTYV